MMNRLRFNITDTIVSIYGGRTGLTMLQMFENICLWVSKFLTLEALFLLYNKMRNSSMDSDSVEVKALPKSIAFITPSMQAGGLITVCENYACAFKSKGFEVTLLSLSCTASDAQKEFLSKNGVTLVQTTNKVFGLKHVFPVLKQLLAFFKRQKSLDCIYITSLIPAIIVLIAHKLTVHRSKAVVNLHTTMSEYFKTQSKAKVLCLKLLSVMLKRATVIACDSANSANDAQESLGVKDIAHIYNPICTLEDLKNVPECPSHSWLENGDMLVFLACGRLAYEKNFSLMLQSFQHVYEKLPNARLLILGDGPLKEDLLEEVNDLRINDAVDFYGQTTSVRSFMYHADYFWMTSRFEGAPIVIGEALSQGTPCIASNCPGGVGEMIEGGKYGALIPFESSASEMAAAIVEYVKKDKEERSFYKNRARAFTSDKAAEKILELCED